jgi:hypothetical protein
MEGLTGKKLCVSLNQSGFRNAKPILRLIGDKIVGKKSFRVYRVLGQGRGRHHLPVFEAEGGLDEQRTSEDRRPSNGRGRIFRLTFRASWQRREGNRKRERKKRVSESVWWPSTIKRVLILPCSQILKKDSGRYEILICWLHSRNLYSILPVGIVKLFYYSF